MLIAQTGKKSYPFSCTVALKNPMKTTAQSLIDMYKCET